jgi:transcriptional regulator with XRE-family HTH domain
MGLSRRLKELRNNRDWSLTKTAEALGVSVTTYREWEEGRKIPVERLASLAELHGTSISDLLGKKQVVNEELAMALSVLKPASVMCVRLWRSFKDHGQRAEKASKTYENPLKNFETSWTVSRR